MARRLVVDGRMLGDGGTGVSSYARTLIAAATMAGRAPGTLCAIRGPDGGVARLRRWAVAAASRPRPLRVADGGDLVGDDLFRQAKIHFNLRRRLLTLVAPGPPGIVHWTYPVPLRVAGWTNLYTVHDAIPLTHPALTSIHEGRHRQLLAAVIAGADRIVTVSGAAARDIVGATGCDPALVVDCGLAAMLPEPDATPPAGLVPQGYFLFCGQIEPRKNLERLIAAHARAATGLPLVLVGPDGWRAAPILAAARAAGVVRLPYQPRAAIAALMRDARALLFPSLAEGFGLPLAEAMALGTPAMISRDPALVEVAGGAALAVDGGDEGAMAAAIARLAADEAFRADLSARGRERAHAFTLDRFAARLAALYAAFG